MNERNKTITNLHFDSINKSQVKAHCDLGSESEWLSLWIEIPSACHLNCAYCFAKPSEKNKAHNNGPKKYNGILKFTKEGKRRKNFSKIITFELDEKFNIINVNGALEEIYYTKDDLIATPVKDFISEEYYYLFENTHITPIQNNTIEIILPDKTRKFSSLSVIEMKKTLKIEDYIRIIEEFADQGGKYLGIPGKGEPFLYLNRAIVKKIIEVAHNNKIQTTIFTTGDTIFFSPKDSDNADPQPNYNLVNFLSDKDVILLIKCNSLKPDVQDGIVKKKGYTDLRTKALDLLINKYKFNEQGKLGIVTSIMKENKDEIIDLYKYAKKNNLIFDCDTILQRGQGISFFEQNEISYTEIKEVFDKLQKEGAFHTNPGGTYVGVACDRIKHHLYIDIEGNVYPCIGCADTLKDDLKLGNIKEYDLGGAVHSSKTTVWVGDDDTFRTDKGEIAEIDNFNIRNRFWEEPIREKLRNKYNAIFEGVCANCENFLNQTCYSCMGRSVHSFKKIDSKGTIVFRTSGCINHKPDITAWMLAVENYLRNIMGEKCVEELLKRGLENLWQENKNTAFTLSQMSLEDRLKKIEAFINIPDSKTPLLEDNKIDKLSIGNFSNRKHYSRSGLDFPLNKAWDFLNEPNYFTNSEVFGKDYEGLNRKKLFTELSKSVLSNVFLPSLKILIEENDKTFQDQGNILLCNLLLYDDILKKNFYRTFSMGDFDISNFKKPEDNPKFLQSIFMFRWAENFSNENLFKKHILNLSDIFKKKFNHEYEFVLKANSDGKNLSENTNLYDKPNYTINISSWINPENNPEKVSYINKKVSDFKTAFDKKLSEEGTKELILKSREIIFERKPGDEIINAIKKLYSDIAEECFYKENDISKIISDEELYTKNLLLLINDNFIDFDKKLTYSTVFNESEGNFFKVIEKSKKLSYVNEPLVEFIRLFDPLTKDDFGRHTLPRIFNYIIFLGILEDMGVGYYYLFHSTNFDFAGLKDNIMDGEKFKKRTPSSILICSKNNLPDKTKNNIKILLNNILRPFDEKYSQYREEEYQKKLKQQATIAAISQVMARNTAHNLSSHCKTRISLKQIYQRLKKLYIIDENSHDINVKKWIEFATEKFNQYEIARSEYVADYDNAPRNIQFYKDLILPFCENTLLLDNIAASENIEYTDCGTNKIRVRCFINDFEMKAFYKNLTCFNSPCNNEIPEICYPDHYPYLLISKNEFRNEEGKEKYINDVFNFKEIVGFKNNEQSSNADVNIAIHNEQGFYSLLENFIRNSAKHNKPKFITQDLEIYIKLKENGEYYTLYLYDNVSSQTPVRIFNNDDKNPGIFDRINQSLLIDASVRRENWGFADMKINAFLLFNKAIDLSDDKLKNNFTLVSIQSDSETGIETFKVIEEKPINDIRFGYQMNISKARDVLWIGELPYEIESFIKNGLEHINNIEDIKSLKLEGIAAFSFAVVNIPNDNLQDDEIIKQINDNKSYLPGRILLISSGANINLSPNIHITSLQDLKKDVNNNFKCFIKNCWEAWLKRLLPKKPKLFVYYEDDIKASTSKLISILNSNPQKQPLSEEDFNIIFDRHGNGQNQCLDETKYKLNFYFNNSTFYFDKGSDDFSALYYLPANEIEADIFAYEIMDAATTNIFIIDERIAGKRNIKPPYSSDFDIFGIKGGKAGCFDVVYQAGKVFVITKINDEIIYESSDYFQYSEKKENSDEVKKINFSTNSKISENVNSLKKDILIIHRTYLKDIDIDLALSSFGSVIVTSGGGYPHNLNQDLKFIPFSIIDRLIDTRLSKIRLIKWIQQITVKSTN